MLEINRDDYFFEKIEPLQLPLVNRFYKECRYPAKAGKGDEVFCLKKNGKIVAAVKLMNKPMGSIEWQFLRAMCVSPDYRRIGLGSFFLLQLKSQLASSVYCYPFNYLKAFYASIGFREVKADEELPEAMVSGLKKLQQQGRDVLLMVREQ